MKGVKPTLLEILMRHSLYGEKHQFCGESFNFKKLYVHNDAFLTG